MYSMKLGHCESKDAMAVGVFRLLFSTLAFCFGISILRALIIAAAQHIGGEAVKQKVVAIVENGFAFPKCNHGEYKENMFSQFYFTYKENNYNTLSLAETLFCIEVYNLVRNGLPADVLRRY